MKKIPSEKVRKTIEKLLEMKIPKEDARALLRDRFGFKSYFNGKRRSTKEAIELAHMLNFKGTNALEFIRKTVERKYEIEPEETLYKRELNIIYHNFFR